MLGMAACFLQRIYFRGCLFYDDALHDDGFISECASRPVRSEMPERNRRRIAA